MSIARPAPSTDDRPPDSHFVTVHVEQSGSYYTMDVLDAVAQPNAHGNLPQVAD